MALAVVLAAACGPAVDETVPPPDVLSQADRDQVEQMLLGWEQEWVDAYLTGDLSALERILADDFIYTIDDGTVQDKASFIALGADDPISYTRYDLGEMSVRWYADVVVITGTASSVGTDADGDTVSGAGVWTNVFVQRDGQWQCVVGHSTAIVQ